MTLRFATRRGERETWEAGANELAESCQIAGLALNVRIDKISKPSRRGPTKLTPAHTLNFVDIVVFVG
jgi:hypothetical protein